MTAKETREAQARSCPFCGAAPGEPCHDPPTTARTGKRFALRWLHMVRYNDPEAR